MTAEELADATREFDDSTRFEDTRPLSAESQARWNGTSRASRPRSVTLKLDARLLDHYTAYASRHNISLAEAVERSLRSNLPFVEEPPTRRR
jgi:hypothetical protein